MSKANLTLRLQPALLEEARKLAQSRGMDLNAFINTAVAGKVSALRAESYIAERAAQADIPKALQVLKRAGVGSPSVKGDEVMESKSERR